MGDSKTFGIPEAKGLNIYSLFQGLTQSDYLNCLGHLLTSSRRRTSKHAKKMLCRRAESVLTRIPIFASFVRRLVNTPLVACHSCG